MIIERRLSLKKLNIYTIALGIIAVIGIYFFGLEKANAYRKPYYFAPPEVIKYFSFGYNDIYADLLWIRYIQNADFCRYEQGIPVYDGKTKYKCHKGWAYHMSNAITELAPRFKKPYVLSSVIMGVIMGDKEGTRLILDKAVERFPDDWDISFHAGHHYLMELNQPYKAADLLLNAAKRGGPIWLYSLSAKLYSESGRLDVAEKMVMKLIEDDPDSSFIKGFQRRLREIRALKAKTSN